MAKLVVLYSTISFLIMEYFDTTVTSSRYRHPGMVRGGPALLVTLLERLLVQYHSIVHGDIHRDRVVPAGKDLEHARIHACAAIREHRVHPGEKPGDMGRTHDSESPVRPGGTLYQPVRVVVSRGRGGLHLLLAHVKFSISGFLVRCIGFHGARAQ